MQLEQGCALAALRSPLPRTTSRLRSPSHLRPTTTVAFPPATALTSFRLPARLARVPSSSPALPPTCLPSRLWQIEVRVSKQLGIDPISVGGRASRRLTARSNITQVVPRRDQFGWCSSSSFLNRLNGPRRRRAWLRLRLARRSLMPRRSRPPHVRRKRVDGNKVQLTDLTGLSPSMPASLDQNATSRPCADRSANGARSQSDPRARLRSPPRRFHAGRAFAG